MKPLAKILLCTATTVVASATLAGALAAQSPAAPRLELRPFVGAYVPTGDQADLLSAAVSVGAQGAFNVTRRLSVLGTASWAPSSLEGVATDDGASLFQYDLGAEFRQPIALANGMTIAPFVGLGAGGRTYSYESDALDCETNFAGYGAVGGQLRLGLVGLRLEVRDYVSSFKGLQGELSEAKARNDLTVLTAVSIAF